MKTILIAGGAGFIGSHLTEKYLAEGNRVVVVDNLQTTFTPKNLAPFFANERFVFVRADICEPLRLPRSVKKIDWIFNAACAGSPTSYQFDPVHTWKTSTIGVLRLLQLARQHSARFMQFSTSEVYGDPLESPQKETYLGNVRTTGLRACYDEGKRAAETVCMDFHREYALDVRIIRIFNTYGPNMDVNDGRAITNFITRALRGETLEIYGSGEHTRSFQYIDDLVRGIHAMMSTDGVVGPVNLGNPGEISMRDLAEHIIAVTSSTSTIRYLPPASDDPHRRCPDITLAKKILNWEPTVSFAEGLTKTITYFQHAPRADQDMLVFATTFGQDGGPAEEAFLALMKRLPQTRFHVITSRFRSDRPKSETWQGAHVYRVGLGRTVDKYLLPFLGPLKARQLSKETNVRFILSIMGSFSAIAAQGARMLLPIRPHMITFLHDSEGVGVQKKSIRRFFVGLYQFMTKRSGRVFLFGAPSDATQSLVGDGVVAPRVHDDLDFLRTVNGAIEELINEQEKKLSRFK